MPYINKPIGERFLSALYTISGSECILWKGCTTKAGYGKLQENNKEIYVHRYSYELFVEKIPEGLVIDHICRNKACVNPSHLRVVTNRENVVFNSESAAALNLLKSHCKNGHEFTPKNTIMMPPETPTHIPSRRCKECARTRNREYLRVHGDDRNARRRAQSKAAKEASA